MGIAPRESYQVCRAAWLEARATPTLSFICISSGEQVRRPQVGIWIVPWVGIVLD